MAWLRRSGGASLSDAPPFMMPEPIWQILSGRGYLQKEEIENLFQPKLRDLAHPFSLDGMDIAIARLLKAFQLQEKILIYGDYDLDGTPGLVLLHDGLTRLGFQNVSVFQPSRLNDGYGLHENRITEFHKDGVSLILTVDVGITDTASVDYANSLGLDVIVTDHHLPKETLPSALAIVNPNKGTCTSSLQHLCGTGVAFYLILALRMEMTKLNLLKEDFDPKVLLDLFALATITDMVPLVRENRVLVKHGLIQLAKSQRPGIKKLFRELGFANKKISSQDIAFRIAPKLNALTRLEEGVRALDVLMASEDDAGRLVDEAIVINQRRVQFQEQAKKISAELVKNYANEKFIWIYSHDFHPGVISLIASDLMGQYNVPAFVGCVREDGRIMGSARAPSKKYNLQDMLKRAEKALHKFGGHQLAAGFEVTVDRAEQIQHLLSDYFKENLSLENNEEPEVMYDAEVKIKELDAEFMNWYENLGPFGMQFEVPKLLLKGVKVKKLKRLKGSYLKYTLESGAAAIEAPWFSNPVEIPEGSRVDVIFEPQWNDFNGRRSIQGLIHNMRLNE
ncbi:MAG: single-stranded-DNA-specific exonuclease RecJ [Bdellovibrionales bacterium]|nr:single-stranded-DNA-specific exonuclease RecJ [Bdellovibrionales bacterium]